MHSPSSVPASSCEPLPPWKRGLDIACCLIALPFLALGSFWVFVMTSITAPGPIFFRQERVGHKGRRFLLYKFRTMHVSANVTPHQVHFRELMTSNAPMQKLDARGDRRLIPGGWLLRASGLDELPQIINVLRGEMSIVGPRPCIPYEFENYSVWQRNRLNSVPGLTGLWQVSGKNRTTFDEMVRLDIAYGEQLSFQSDIGIMLRTLPALWTQISDIRKARAAASRPVEAAAKDVAPREAAPREVAPLAPSAPAGAVSPSPANGSLIFAARTQGAVDGTRLPGLWTTQERRLSFTSATKSAAVVRSSDRNGPHG
jgi:lipopolysaccharide/colanic/teichoic acid biosynthesis glycosyltransferase